MKDLIFKILLPLTFLILRPDLRAEDQWIVVTTIQYPTEQLKKLSQIPGWKLVVVGDKKTPKDWYLENCEYLSPERQLELGYEIASLLPWNHYSRKNVGYLYAIENGAKIIYETDDDNEPFGSFQPLPIQSDLIQLVSSADTINVYEYFGQPDVWPRGYPLENISSKSDLSQSYISPCSIGIEQGIVDESPDVDAIYRLTQDKEIFFQASDPCFLPEGVFCPFNSQNTFFHEKAFFSLYLPSSVSMRVADIWRGYVAQKLIWYVGSKLAFSGPNAVQKRNEHNLFHDFILEQDLFLRSSALIKYLKNWQAVDFESPLGIMENLFEELVQQGFFQEKEIPLVQAWINDLEKVLN